MTNFSMIFSISLEVLAPPGDFLNVTNLLISLKDAKLGSGSSKPKVSPEQAFAEPRHEAEKLQAGFESNPKRTPDHVWADFEIQSAKFNDTIRQSGVQIGEAFDKLAEERSKNFKEVAAEIEIARKQMNMFAAGVIVFAAASMGVGKVLVSRQRIQHS